jgi:hypothetical protein
MIDWAVDRAVRLPGGKILRKKKKKKRRGEKEVASLLGGDCRSEMRKLGSFSFRNGTSDALLELSVDLCNPEVCSWGFISSPGVQFRRPNNAEEVMQSALSKIAASLGQLERDVVFRAAPEQWVFRKEKEKKMRRKEVVMGFKRMRVKW